VSDGTWVPLPEGTPFPLANLPYGLFTTGDGARVGVAIGDHILDLTAAEEVGLIGTAPPGAFAARDLNAFAAHGPETWSATRDRIGELLTDGAAADRVLLIPQAEARMLLPVRIGDYVDFYSSLEHASNVGRLFRPGEKPLLPNWRHLPVGYHGRASTVVVSGTEVTRPSGQRSGDSGPVFGPSTRLDFELEVGFIVGPGNGEGDPITTGDAEDHIFGLCLVNDWSARDIQAWEYVPLGPFLGKSFATTISPWIVPLAALAPHRVPPPTQNPPVLPHLRAVGDRGVAIDLTVSVNGTVVRPGDLCASGTVSGPTPGSGGSLLELTWNGGRPITLDDGSRRTFLEDGDTVVMTGGAGEIGFGACAGTIRPAR